MKFYAMIDVLSRESRWRSGLGTRESAMTFCHRVLYGVLEYKIGVTFIINDYSVYSKNVAGK